MNGSLHQQWSHSLGIHDTFSSGVQRLELQVEQNMEAGFSFFCCTLYQATMRPDQDVKHVPHVETQLHCPQAFLI